MDIGKLFGVLVVGGAMLTAGCNEDEKVETPDANAVASPAGDAGEAMPDGAGAADASSEELMECGFCPNDCCVIDEQGNSAAKEGFVCCWGTSC